MIESMNKQVICWDKHLQHIQLTKDQYLEYF